MFDKLKENFKNFKDDIKENAKNFKNYNQMQKKDFENMSSDRCILRIQRVQIAMVVLTIIFIPNMLFCFFSGEVSGGIIFLLFVCGVDISGYFGIKSLKKKYKQALLREKQEKEKENQNEKDN